MKKFCSLTILVLLTLLLQNGSASSKDCGDKVDMEWNLFEKKNFARFTITSSCEHPIYMLYVSVLTKDSKQIKKKDLNRSYIRPYGKETFDLYIGDLNQNIIEFGRYLYSMNDGKNLPTSNKSSNKYNNKSSGSNFEGLIPTLVTFGLIGLIIFLATRGKNSGSKSKYPKTYNEPVSSENFDEVMPKAEIQRRYKIVAKFYNDYKFINYSNIKNKKIALKQMEDIVNVVDKNLSEISAGTENTPYRMLIVGMVTFKLLTANQIKKVHNDLAKMYKLGERLEFDDRLMNALRNILDDNAGIDY